MALYNENDANRAIEQFSATDFNVKTKIAEETFVTFHPAGHILGASVVEIEFFGKRLLFSGDLGRPEHPLLSSPENIPAGSFDSIVVESTYGDREHIDEPSNLAQIIRETVERGGSILIPAFAVDRTEVILVELRKLLEAGAIPAIPVYADSPMALKALALYREAINESSPEIRADVLADKLTTDPFDAGQLVELPTVEDSMSVNNPTSPCIIISASGMATGGRVVHHLANMLPVPKHTIVLVGYQAVGTRGRRLLEGEEFVKMHGKEIPVKAQIEQVNSFSVHADASELIDWLRTSSEPPKKVFIVHGEGDSSIALQDKIKRDLGWESVIPKDNQVIGI
jgi:metallo-beta-lactamase family protein